MVGYSRQEAGDVPEKDQVYYWGRMHFTQTNDYLGLLPWFLLPLTLVFIRDRYTRFFSFLLVATLLMALGKYTFVYRFMFEHLPGFSTFRVPKMIMFLFAFAAAVLMGRGVDLIMSDRDRKGLRTWFTLIVAGVVSLWLFRLYAGISGRTIIALAGEFIGVPTRYQSGQELVLQRYNHLVSEAGTAALLATVCLGLFVVWYRRWISGKVMFVLLMVFMVGDLWHVNRNFFVLVPPPHSDNKVAKNDVVSFLEPRIGNYRMQPLGGESATYYAEYGLANISAYVTVSEKRYTEFLDVFSWTSSLPDMINLKYLVMPEGEYQAQQGRLAGKYSPVFNSGSGRSFWKTGRCFPRPGWSPLY